MACGPQDLVEFTLVKIFLFFFCGNKSESGWWHRKVISQVSVASLD